VLWVTTATLAPPATESLTAKLSAVGVQIYICNGTLAGAYSWTLLAPQANLFNDDGKFVGTHLGVQVDCRLRFHG
jgi:hypothetical protein